MVVRASCQCAPCLPKGKAARIPDTGFGHRIWRRLVPAACSNSTLPSFRSRFQDESQDYVSGWAEDPISLEAARPRGNLELQLLTGYQAFTRVTFRDITAREQKSGHLPARSLI